MYVRIRRVLKDGMEYNLHCHSDFIVFNYCDAVIEKKLCVLQVMKMNVIYNDKRTRTDAVQGHTQEC